MPINTNEYLFMIQELLDVGGVVMLPLFFCALLLWYGLGFRFWVMKTPKSMGIRDMLDFYDEYESKPTKNIVEQAAQYGIWLKKKKVNNLRRHLDEAFYGLKSEIRQFSTMVKTVVIISPLLGLLGTVIGMIETFDSLAAMALFTQSGGIAGGISQALISTQIGLAVAIPGLLIHSIQTKKQQQIERDLSQIKELLCRQSDGVNPTRSISS